MELLRHRDNASRHLDVTVTALRAFNLNRASAAVRLAASETRSMADAVAVVEPEVDAHFIRAADALDNAATQMDQFDVHAAIGYMKQGNNEVGQGVKLIDAADYC